MSPTIKMEKQTGRLQSNAHERERERERVLKYVII